MPNNFGLRTRSVNKAGHFVLNNAARAGHLSFASAATISHRWNIFCKWLKASFRVKNLEGVSFYLVREYGQELAWDVSEEVLACSTAQNYLSAVNSVMFLATKGHWLSVSPTTDCGIPHRSAIRTAVPASLNRTEYTIALQTVRAEFGERGAVIVELCRELGLRSKEASLLNAKSAYAQARSGDCLVITAGTKGGRSRRIPILTSNQFDALNRAETLQESDISLIPTNQNWREWREGDLREIRELIQKTLGASGLHDLRAAYACERYQSLTGLSAPLLRVQGDRDIDDSQARQIIAEELGHARSDISGAYIGGKK